ncbi:MAG: hypothetical protein ABJH28_01735 [Paraglaciecola sp.]|uniref:hypothetical protein n=1 Tax=Paraglaciecola sp. TaxID=1920173 RepID=UPI003267FBDA
MLKLTKHKLASLVFWWLVIIPAIPFVLVTIGISIYVYWPRDFSSVSEFQIAKGTQYITLSAHGVNDSPSSWSDELQQAMTAEIYPQLQSVNQHHQSIDWQDYSDNVFLCSVAGKKIGLEIGERLAEVLSLKAIHAVGHSCGSFVVLGICEGLKSMNSNILVQTSYLDPVSVYSGFYWDYGIEYFGTCADFTDNYIDTRDTVPGSNIPLPHGFTFDVTLLQTPEYSLIPPHAWPTRYYLNAYKAQQVPILYLGNANTLQSYKKGESLVLH